MAKLKPAEAATETFKRLKKAYPGAKVELQHKNALELMVATILSAQCTDERVNKVTKELFKKYRSVKDYANASQREFEKDIHSTGFYKNKTKNIIKACQLIEERHDGKVPKTMAELLELPGIARKTANIVLGGAFGVVEGIPVDTHVTRLSQRIGLTRNKDPKKIEQDLMALLPQSGWWEISTLLIWHGRRTCMARKPNCGECVLNDFCPRIGVGAKV